MKSMNNIYALIYCICMNTYNILNEKRPHVPFVHFYMLVWFNSHIHFHTSLSVRVSYWGQPANWARKYCTKITRHKLHNYTPEFFTIHHTVIDTHTIQHTNIIYCQPVTCSIKYCMRQKYHSLQNYTNVQFTRPCTIIHTKTLRTRMSWFKIYSIKLHHFLPW